MKKTIVCTAAVVLSLSSAQVAFADDDFRGVIERRPTGKVGTWVVGGRTFSATHDTDLENRRKLRVGNCAEVEIDDGEVEEIEAVAAYKCPNLRKKTRATINKQPTDDFYGIVQRRPQGKRGMWMVGNYKFRVSRDVELDADYAPIQTGACVQVDIDDGRVEEIETKPMYKCRAG